MEKQNTCILSFSTCNKNLITLNSICQMETTEKENLNLIILLSRWMPTEYFSYLSTPFIL